MTETTPRQLSELIPELTECMIAAMNGDRTRVLSPTTVREINMGVSGYVRTVTSMIGMVANHKDYEKLHPKLAGQYPILKQVHEVNTHTSQALDAMLGLLLLSSVSNGAEGFAPRMRRILHMFEGDGNAANFIASGRLKTQMRDFVEGGF